MSTIKATDPYNAVDSLGRPLTVVIHYTITIPSNAKEDYNDNGQHIYKCQATVPVIDTTRIYAEIEDHPSLSKRLKEGMHKALDRLIHKRLVTKLSSKLVKIDG